MTRYRRQSIPGYSYPRHCPDVLRIKKEQTLNDIQNTCLYFRQLL